MYNNLLYNAVIMIEKIFIVSDYYNAMLPLPERAKTLSEAQKVELINTFYSSHYLSYVINAYSQLINYKALNDVVKYGGANPAYDKTNDNIKMKLGILIESMQGSLDNLYKELNAAQNKWIDDHIATKEPIVKETVKEPTTVACDSIVVEPESVVEKPTAEPSEPIAEPVVEKPVSEPIAEPIAEENVSQEESIKALLKTKAARSRAKKKVEMPKELDPKTHAAPASFPGTQSIICDKCGRLKRRCICARDA